MNNAKLLTDIIIAATALATPFLHAKPAVEATGLSGFLAPRRAIARHVSKAKVLLKRKLTYTVTATAYQAVANQTDSEPFITADNSRIKPHYGSKKRWMALSRDLLRTWGGPFDYGDKVRVSGISPKLDGVYTVHDTMNRRHRHCMDVLTHVSEKFDIYQPGVKIQLVEHKQIVVKM